MKKIKIVAIIVFCVLLNIFYQYVGRAGFVIILLPKSETTDGTGKTGVVPISPPGKKPITIKLTIAGLGTSRVTAQSSFYPLEIENQIYPLNEPASALEPGIDWYYSRQPAGMIIIELKEDNVKLHLLGYPDPWTYMGKLDKRDK